MEVFYIKQELPINRQIRAKEVQLIGETGEKLGVVSFQDALSKAEDKNLDLVLVAPNSNPPVCKIMNYGKYKFEQAKKEKEAKKKQKILFHNKNWINNRWKLWLYIPCNAKTWDATRTSKLRFSEMDN